MKRKIALVFIALAASVFALSVSAQGKYGADSAECIKYLSYYREYYKQKNYKDALPNWRQAYKLCPPSSSQNLLIHGSSLMQNAIAGEKLSIIRNMPRRLSTIRVFTLPNTSKIRRNCSMNTTKSLNSMAKKQFLTCFCLTFKQPSIFIKTRR